MKLIKTYIFLISGVLIFWILYTPFLGTIPYLDGGIDFVKANDFYTGGLTKLFKNWSSVHPPFKLLIASFLYKIFGLSSFSFTLIGLVWGTLGIFYFHLLNKNLLDKVTTNLSTILLATCPLFISTGIFSLVDFLLTNLIIISLYYYSKKKYIAYSLFSSLAFLTKETAMVLILSVLLIELTYLLKNKRDIQLRPTVYFLLPLLVSFTWFYFLKLNNEPTWQDWNFSKTADRGTVYTIIYNLLTFNFLNKYAYQNWLQLFFLNFNWVYWLLIVIGMFLFPRIKFTKVTLVMISFSVIYFLTVLSFQTYTIPRYALPIYPFMLMGAAISIRKLQKRFRSLKDKLVASLVFIVIISLFSSSDPVSRKLWGEISILGQRSYGLNRHLAGNDGITYNMQYLFLARQRAKQIYNRDRSMSVISNDCYWIFPDPNNDFKVIKILNIDINPQKPCKETKSIN